MANTTLDDAVKAAVAAEPPITDVTDAAPNTEESVETKKTEEPIQKSENELGFDVDEAKQALQLVAALRDPVAAKNAIRLMAEQIGLQISEGTAPKAAIKDTLADLTEGVPDEMKWVIESLRPGLEKLVNKTVEERVKTIETNQATFEQKEYEKEVDRNFEVLRNKYKDFDEFDAQMNELAQQMPPAPGTNHIKYLENLYKLASSEKSESVKVAKVVDKINKNAQRTQVSSAETAETVISTGSRLPSVDEAVRAAFANQKFTR